MIALTIALLVALAIAAPLVGEDSRVVDAERHEPWWPGERSGRVARRAARLTSSGAFTSRAASEAAMP